MISGIQLQHLTLLGNFMDAYAPRFLLEFFFFQAEDGIRDYKVTWSSDVCSSDLECRAWPCKRGLPVQPAVDSSLVGAAFGKRPFKSHDRNLPAGVFPPDEPWKGISFGVLAAALHPPRLFSDKFRKNGGYGSESHLLTVPTPQQ